jgi:hypothetical protein
MPTPTDYEREVQNQAVELFYRMYEDELDFNHIEDCVRAAVLQAIQQVEDDLY